MTRPTHTVKFAQANFKRYQVLAIIFALLTVSASLLAALSGIQIKALQKTQAEAMASSSADEKQRAEAAAQSMEALQKQLSSYQEQLAAEKQNVKNLIGKIAELERRLSSTESKMHAQQQKAMDAPPPTPAPTPMEITPEEIKPPVTDSPPTEAPVPAESNETEEVPIDQNQNAPADQE